MLEKVKLEGFFVLTITLAYSQPFRDLQIIEKKGNNFLTVRIVFVYIYIRTYVLILDNFAKEISPNDTSFRVEM